MSLRGSMFPTWRTNRSGSRYWALTGPTSSAGEAGDMSGLGGRVHDDGVESEKAPDPFGGERRHGDDGVRPSERMSDPAPARRPPGAAGKAHGVSKMARSCTVETIGPGRRSGRSTSSPWVRSAFPNPTAPVSARRIPPEFPLISGWMRSGSSERHLPAAPRPPGRHRPLGDHGGEELAYVGADPAATGDRGAGRCRRSGVTCRLPSSQRAGQRAGSMRQRWTAEAAPADRAVTVRRGRWGISSRPYPRDPGDDERADRRAPIEKMSNRPST